MAAMTETRTLEELGRAAGELFIEVVGDPQVSVGGGAHDSREVTPGSLFFCVAGERDDGHDFATQAVQAGAAALCVERRVDVDVPQLVVRKVREAMPLVGAALYGNPGEQLVMLGVTGTNGKTTTTYLLDAIARADGRTTGLIGTIETRVGNEVRPGVRTTPESLDLQKLLAEMLVAGVDTVSMEVTSHALVLNRVDGLRFSSAGFTNLTQDHLDFHEDMEEYFAAKASLFTPQRAERGAVNVDDPYGQRIKEASGISCVGFGRVESAEVRVSEVELEPTGSRFTVVTPKGETQLSTSLVGPFNVSNCLTATAIALQAGIGLDAIERGIASLRTVPGRFESVDAGQPFAVVVDYAHTPDSLDNVLVAARRVAALKGGRVITVFGCGGDRDRGKRPLMGMAAARGADYLIVTSDNPRSEVPEAIVGEILEGVRAVSAEGPDAALVDRRAAIEHALAEARPDDVVVIAGKGHETGQQFADRTIPFDDRVVARETLATLGWESSGD
ncbi:MAG: UDP-N-acetylmuramoyl-L-alanyl-D-glutamate--2,6-diaminopimelate ligase [Actinomycetota bacterium]